MTRKKILEQVSEERDRQVERWGVGHDAEHTAYDWVARLTKHAGLALMEPVDPAAFRRQMVRVAAIAVAAVEATDTALEG